MNDVHESERDDVAKRSPSGMCFGSAHLSSGTATATAGGGDPGRFTLELLLPVPGSAIKGVQSALDPGRALERLE